MFQSNKLEKGLEPTNMTSSEQNFCVDGIKNSFSNAMTNRYLPVITAVPTGLVVPLIDIKSTSTIFSVSQNRTVEITGTYPVVISFTTQPQVTQLKIYLSTPCKYHPKFGYSTIQGLANLFVETSPGVPELVNATYLLSIENKKIVLTFNFPSTPTSGMFAPTVTPQIINGTISLNATYTYRNRSI